MRLICTQGNGVRFLEEAQLGMPGFDRYDELVQLMQAGLDGNP